MIIAFKSIIHKETKNMKKARYTKGYTVALRPDVFERIKSITDENETSIADYIREAINAALETNQREEDTM
jgi:predicted DNA-binding protein